MSRGKPVEAYQAETRVFGVGDPVMIVGMSKRQKQIFDIIVGYIEEHGTSPSVNQLAAMTGVAPNATVGSISSMTKKGWIKRDRWGKIGICHTYR